MIKKRSRIAATVIALLCLCICVIPCLVLDRPKESNYTMLVLFLMELMSIVIIRVIYNALELKERTLKEQEMNAQLMFAEQHYQMLSDNIEQVRGLKHDMKHHFVMMQKLLADGKYEELKDYMEKLRSTTELDLTPYGKNYHISVLAAFFAEQAETKHIRFQCKVNVPEELFMSAPNLSGVLGNMWQNAIEACMDLPVDEDFILRDGTRVPIRIKEKRRITESYYRYFVEKTLPQMSDFDV